MKRTSSDCVGAAALIVVLLGWISDCPVGAADWPMLGRDGTRNGVSAEFGAPTLWSTEQLSDDRVICESRGVRWTAPLGSQTHSSPVVSGGFVWIGTNSQPSNAAAPEIHSVLKCFRVDDGKQLYEYDSPKLSSRIHDPGWTGLGSSPLIEGDRLWLATNRSEVLCLDIGPLIRGEGEPRELWKIDLIKTLDIYPHHPIMGPPRPCSIGPSWNGRIFVTTNNGVGEDGVEVPKPEGPNLVCLNKDTGEVLWKDNSPGPNILTSQFASPTVAEIRGQMQVIVPQSDGWVRAFDPMTGEKFWEFDANAKVTDWTHYGRGSRNSLLGNAVVYEDLVYLVSGRDAEQGEGPARLVCIDPSLRGDVSSELAVDSNERPLPRRRMQAVDQKAGEKAIPNPNSALVWEFVSLGKEFKDEMHRTMSSVAVANGLVIVGDASGLVHCFDAQTGQRYWQHDMLATIWTSPLIVDDKIYMTDDDADVAIFGLSADPAVALRNVNGEPQPLRNISMVEPIYSSPIFANGTLYVATRTTLFAIAVEDEQLDPDLTGGFWPQWRGPNRDNLSSEKGLLKDWPEAGPPLRWRVESIGEGIASVSVSGGRIMTVGYREGGEYAVALNEKTGNELWSTRIGPAVPENSLMRWLSQRSPTIDVERAYFVTASGDLVCLLNRDGRELWRKNYAADFGGRGGLWRFCDYPLIDGEHLVCTPGGADATIVALNKMTGKPVWKTAVPEGDTAAYAAMVVARSGGVRQYITFLQKGIVGVAADNGRLLWRYDKLTSEQNSFTPIVLGDCVLCASARGKAGIALLKLAATGKAFQVKEDFLQPLALNPFQDSLVAMDGHVYGTTRRGPVCVETATGKVVWETPPKSSPSRLPMCALVAANGSMVLRQSDGVVKNLEASPHGYSIHGSFSIPDHQPSMGATNPVIAAGRLYLRDDNQLLCYELRDAAHQPPTTGPRKIAFEPATAATNNETGNRTLRSVFVPTPQDIVGKMLELAEVKQADVVCDLGSGDGRIVITAAKTFGCKAIGYELDKELVDSSRAKVEAEGVKTLVTIESKDLFTADLRAADVVAVYLLPQQLERLLPQLELLKPGARIVSHQFAIPGVSLDKVVHTKSTEDGAKHTLYLWTTPLKNENK